MVAFLEKNKYMVAFLEKNKRVNLTYKPDMTGLY